MRPHSAIPHVLLGLVMLALGACKPGSTNSDAASAKAGDALPKGLLVALAELGENEDGSPKPLPATLGIITRSEGDWHYRTIHDPDSNVFHKAMVYTDATGRSGVLTLGGTQAKVKLWFPDGSQQTLWEADFGGNFSRMRDAEVGDVYGDGKPSIVVGTHDQGVVAVIHPTDDGGYDVKQLDHQADTFVHEIELGDLDGDGTLEVYATLSEPNRADGTPQAGQVVRYVPAEGEGRHIVADLGTRHAKEILVGDVDGDGRDELYASVEAVSEADGKVEIRRYDADTPPDEGEVIAEIDDTQLRFLTAGDIDGDGKKEMVAAAFNAGLWLLRPTQAKGTLWPTSLIDADSGGFEHASILTDLDGDGVDELYVASDKDNEIRQYTYEHGAWQQELLVLHLDDLGRFTWNLMPAPVDILPPAEASGD